VTDTFSDIDFQFSVQPSLPTFSVNDFFAQLSGRVTRFNQVMTKFGIHTDHFGALEPDEEEGKNDDGDIIVTPVNALGQDDVEKFLTFKMTADSSLQIITTNTFQNCFVLEFSQYGMQLLGIDKSKLHKVGARYYLGYSDGEQSVAGQADQFVVVDVNDDPVVPFRYSEGENMHTTMMYSTIPLYECADQRIYVSVSTHLPIDSQVFVQDEVQKSNRDIAIAFFENQLETTLAFDAQNNITHSLKGISYSGQTHLIRKTDMNTKWVKLKNSYDMRFLRFYLHIAYKLFDTVTETYSLKKQDFPITDDNFWQIFVRFVSVY
jgi:hypothetical protein